MVHFASIRHPATILDDLHGKVLNEAYQISKSTVADSVSTEVHRQVPFSSVRAVALSNPNIALQSNIQTHCRYFYSIPVKASNIYIWYLMFFVSQLPPLNSTECFQSDLCGYWERHSRIFQDIFQPAELYSKTL